MLLGIIILSFFWSCSDFLYWKCIFAQTERIRTRERQVRPCIRNEFYRQAFYITVEFSKQNLMKIETKVST